MSLLPLRHPPRGFTLLEMLVVLAIVGLLVALVGPRLLGRLDDSKITTTETQIRMLRTSLDTLRLDIGRYPTTQEGLQLLVSAPNEPELRAKWRGPPAICLVQLRPGRQAEYRWRCQQADWHPAAQLSGCTPVALLCRLPAGSHYSSCWWLWRYWRGS